MHRKSGSPPGVPRVNTIPIPVKTSLAPQAEFEFSNRVRVGQKRVQRFKTLIWGEPSNRLSRNDPLSDSGTVGETGTVVPKRMGVIRSSKMIIRFDEAARLMIMMKRPLG